MTTYTIIDNPPFPTSRNADSDAPNAGPFFDLIEAQRAAAWFAINRACVAWAYTQTSGSITGYYLTRNEPSAPAFFAEPFGENRARITEHNTTTEEVHID